MKSEKTKKVLIALDYNPTAQKVAESGFALAKSMNAEVTLLHIISDPVYYSSAGYSPIMGFSGFTESGYLLLEGAKELKKAAMEFLDKSRDHLGDNDIKIRVEEGNFADSILETSRRLNSDIIVIGTHSRKWLENVIMGSVTEEVLRHSRIPLFIVPTKKLY